jgi:hypothetical protein
MMSLYKLLFISFLGISNGALAQTFFTQVSAKTIGKRDVLRVEYVGENVSISDFTVPDFNNWILVSGPVIGTRSFQSGKLISKRVVYSFALLPKVPGKLTIPGAVAKINARQQKSNAISVLVLSQDHVAGSAPQAGVPPAGNRQDILAKPAKPIDNNQVLQKGESARDRIGDNILVRVESNKKSCFVGEPLLVTYKLCRRLNSESRVIKQPGFTGATVVEMTMNDPLPTREIINGKPYNVNIIRQVQLFPLQAGNLALPEASVENKVSFYNERTLNYRDLFYDSPLTPAEEVTLTIQNAPATIQVKPLPEKPVDFSNGIGNFEVFVSVNSPTNKIETNSTSHLSVVIQGSGNLQQLKMPAIKWPSEIEAFEPNVEGQTDETFFPMRIRKEFSIPFVANKPGDYTLPPISFVYFDNTQNKYVTKTADSLTLHVLQGDVTQLPQILKSKSLRDFNSRLFIILAVAFCSVFIGLIVYNNRQKKKIVTTPAPPPVKVEAVPEKENLAKYIYQIRELQPGYDGPEFYKNLCRSMNAYLVAKFADNPLNLDKVILHNQENAWLVEDVKVVLDICKQGMYTPIYSMEDAMQHRLQAIKILTLLENEKFIL